MDNPAAFVLPDDAAAVLPQIDPQYHYAHGPLIPPLNTGILHRRRPEGRAIHTGGRDDQRGRLIGRTKGGMNTKLHAVTDAEGRPIRFFMTAGEVSDYTGAAALLGSLQKAESLLADPGYDADDCSSPPSRVETTWHFGRSGLSTSQGSSAAVRARKNRPLPRFSSGPLRRLWHALRPEPNGISRRIKQQLKAAAPEMLKR